MYAHVPWPHTLVQCILSSNLCLSILTHDIKNSCAVWCGMLWFGVVWCGAVCRGAVHCVVPKALVPNGNGRDGLAHRKMEAGRAVCLSARCV